MKNYTFLFSIMLLLGLGACSSHKFHTTRLQQTDFNQYKTYGWLPPVDSLSKDYYSNDIAKGNIINTANHELEKRGLQYTKENPDVLFRYIAIVNNKSRMIYSSPYYGGWGWGGPWGWHRPWGMWGMGMGFGGGFSQPVGKERVRYGHLIVEAIDRRTNTVVWQARGTGEVDIPEKAMNDLPKMVQGIFKEYPIAAKKK